MGYHDLEIEGWNIAAVMALAGVFGSNVDYMRCDMQLNSHCDTGPSSERRSSMPRDERFVYH
jgi:hypothetical protein